MRIFWRILLAAAALVVVAALGFIGWIVFGPGPTDFAGRDRVALSDYKLADPTGVPASLKDASLIDRGRYPSGPPIARPAIRRSGDNLSPGAGRSSCPSVRSIRPTLRPTRTQASANIAMRIFSRRSIAASVVTAPRFTPQCPSPVTPT